MPRRGRLIGAVALLAVALSSGSASAQSRIVGGDVITIGQAPYVAIVNTPSFLCSGVIIGPRTVLTAAHCLFTRGGSPVSPAEVDVLAGRSRLDDFTGQTATAERTRIHPYYVAGAFAGPDDIGVIHLSTSLAFNSTVGSIPISTEPVDVAGVTSLGFGSQGSQGFDGRLRRLAGTTRAPDDCGPNNAVEVCHASSLGSPCFGDSGGPLVLERSAGTVLVGIHTGGDECTAGASGVSVRISAPEIHEFVQGSSSPPRAPRPGDTTPEQFTALVAQPISCPTRGFSGQEPMSSFVTFADQDSGQVLQGSESPTYVFVPSDAGRRIGCRVSVSNAGGTYHSPLWPSSFPIMALRPAGLTIELQERFYKLNGATDATAVQLVSTNRAGRQVASRTVAWRVTPPMRTLRAGTYTTCVTSAQTTFYEAGQACIQETVRGRATDLVRQLPIRRRGRRFVLGLRVQDPLVRRRVRVVFEIRPRRGRRYNAGVRRVRLRRTTRIRTPNVPRRAVLRAHIYLPTVRYRGLRHGADRLVIDTPRR